MLDFPMFTSLLLAVLGFVLIAWDISRTKRNPLVIVGGLCLMVMGLSVRLIAWTGVLSTFQGITTDLGVGLLAAGALLAIRRAGARPFFILGLFALSLAGLTYAARAVFAPAAAPGDALLVELGPDDRIEEIVPVLDRYAARYERAFPEIELSVDEDLAQVYLVYASPDSYPALMNALRRDAENVDEVAVNEPVGLLPPPAETPSVDRNPRRPIIANDPLTASQWALEAVNGLEAHALLRDAEPARKAVVAIVDTGVDAGHEDLESTFSRSPASSDKHGHGTHCAGIAGAATHNGVGMASLNWEGRFIEITGFKALSDSGLGSFESIAQAVIDATRADADVISMSLGGFSPAPPKVVRDAIAFARRNGAIVVVAAGNSNQDARNHMPANVDGVIVVAAVDREGRKAAFSNTNTSLKRPIAAPGVDILSLVPGSEYGPKSGTSMATPLVAGLLGVLRALDPDLTEEDAYALLERTGTAGPDADRTGRLIDAEAALHDLLDAQSPSAARFSHGL